MTSETGAKAQLQIVTNLDADYQESGGACRAGKHLRSAGAARRLHAPRRPFRNRAIVARRGDYLLRRSGIP